MASQPVTVTIRCCREARLAPFFGTRAGRALPGLGGRRYLKNQFGRLNAGNRKHLLGRARMLGILDGVA